VVVLGCGDRVDGVVRVVIAAFALWMCGAAAHAADWLLGPGLSRHGDRKGQNERHLGIGVERHWTEEWRGILDARNNSSNDLSVYAVAAYLPWRMGGAFRWGGAAGLATGYGGKKDEGSREKEHALRPMPMGGLAAALEGKRLGLNAVYVPIVSGGVLFVQVKWRLR
jgi:hypothetical protein